MGRQYKGLDHTKVTVKLDKRHFDIVRQYGWELQEQVYAEQDRTGKRKTYNWKMSDVIRDAIDLLGQSVILSDNIETSVCNLLDIADVFDKIDGLSAPAYARSLREAAALLFMFCHDATQHIENGNLMIETKCPTKSKRREYRDIRIEIAGIQVAPSEGAEGPQEGE